MTIPSFETVMRTFRLHPPSSTDSGSYKEFYNIEELKNCSDPNDPFALHKAALFACGVIPYKRNIASEEVFSKIGGGIFLDTAVTGVPKGSGLGTSSILAAACVKALFDFFGIQCTDEEMYNHVLCMEQIMSTGGGWQDQAQTKPWGTITLFSLGGAYIDAGNPFDVVKGAGLIKGTLKDGVVTFEPKELFMGGTMMEAGTGYYLGVDDVTSTQPVFLPTTVLVLPDAVTAQAKAKAAGAKKQTMVMRHADKSKFRHAGKKIRKINSLKKVSATKYIRFQRG